MSSYTLDVSEEQLSVIQAALDIYGRIGMGQVGVAVTEHPDVIGRLLAGDCKAPGLQDVSFLLDNVMKQYVFNLPHNGNYGIRNEEIHESNRVAYDLQQVIRNRLAWDRAGNPDKRDWRAMLGVAYDDPMKTADMPLCNITKVE